VTKERLYVEAMKSVPLCRPQYSNILSLVHPVSWYYPVGRCSNRKDSGYV